MKNSKFKSILNKKLIVIMVVIILLLFILSIGTTILMNNIKTGKLINEKEAELFSYIVYDNKDEMNIKTLIKVNSKIGIEYIKCPDGRVIYGNNKNEIALDYEVEKDKSNKFKIKENAENEVEKDMTITDDTIRDDILKINKITDISGYKILTSERKSPMEGYGNLSYKIGVNGKWVECEKISMFDYATVQENLVNDDGTITIFARIVNNVTNNEIITNEKYKVDTTEKIASIQSDSLINAIKDNDFENGKYEVTISDEVYNLTVYNINQSLEMSVDTAPGATVDVGAKDKYAQNMVVVKVEGDLLIDEGVTVAPYASEYGGPKGMMIYCTGTLINNGTINMTARGAYAVGQNVYLWKNADGSYEYVPATANDTGTNSCGTGGDTRYVSGRYSTYGSGNSARPGVDRGTGGGGAGTLFGMNGGISQGGTAGTSYSGGTAGSGTNTNSYSSYRFSGTPGKEFGGEGGIGPAWGPGNPQGGTGGLLIVYSNSIQGSGKFLSNGSQGISSNSAAGGSSGGGSINIFYNSEFSIEDSQIQANGGASNSCYCSATSSSATLYGGAGGNGTVSIDKIDF